MDPVVKTKVYRSVVEPQELSSMMNVLHQRNYRILGYQHRKGLVHITYQKLIADPMSKSL